MCSSNKDDEAIAAQILSLYSRGNMLIKNFSNYSNDVKCQLFKTYFSSFYCHLSGIDTRPKLPVAQRTSKY